MYGCKRFTRPKMTVVFVHHGGHFYDSLDFFRAGIHAFFARDGAIKGDLGVVYLTFLVLNMRLLLLATYT